MAPTANGVRRIALKHWLPLSLVAAVLVLSLIVRIRLANVPLERDEGEHGYTAQLMLAGNAPWKLAYNMKLPGTDAAYALWMFLFGQTAQAIRVGLLLLNAATVVLITALGSRLFGIAGGAAAGAAYGILSLSRNVLGTIAHSTHYVVFFAVLGTLLLLRASLRPAAVFLCGLAFGFAFLMKQPGIFFAAFGTLYLVWQLRQARYGMFRGLQVLALFGLGCALPYGLLCLWLWRAGVFPRFWFWTVTLAHAYTAQFPLTELFGDAKESLVDVAPPNTALWIFAGAGLVLACARQSTRVAGLFAGVFLVFSFLAVASGGAFEPHYFVLMLPAVALGVGAWAASGGWLFAKRDALMKTLPLFCVAAACVWSVAAQREYLFRMSPYVFSRETYGTNPFPEAEEAARYIALHSAADARIAVLGSEAEIYFYARRRSATGYLFTYGLMEAHPYAVPMQREMMAEIEAAAPEYIVRVNVAASWLVRLESSTDIFTWADWYTSQYYAKAGVIDIPEDGDSKYVWEPAAAEYQPSGSDNVVIYRRR